MGVWGAGSRATSKAQKSTWYPVWSRSPGKGGDRYTVCCCLAVWLSSCGELRLEMSSHAPGHLTRGRVFGHRRAGEKNG